MLWPDGSRTTTYSDGTWTVEAEGIPCVSGGPSHMSCQIAMDTTLTWHAASTAIEVQQAAGALLVAAKGVVCSCMFPATMQVVSSCSQAEPVSAATFCNQALRCSNSVAQNRMTR